MSEEVKCNKDKGETLSEAGRKLVDLIVRIMVNSTLRELEQDLDESNYSERGTPTKNKKQKAYLQIHTINRFLFGNHNNQRGNRKPTKINVLVGYSFFLRAERGYNQTLSTIIDVYRQY
jgi:hypothetical protein